MTDFTTPYLVQHFIIQFISGDAQTTIHNLYCKLLLYFYINLHQLFTPYRFCNPEYQQRIFVNMVITLLQKSYENWQIDICPVEVQF